VDNALNGDQVMTTIPYKRFDEADDATKKIYENIMRTYGSAEPHGIYQLMGHTPEFLDASWLRSRYLFGNDSGFSLKDKHILTLGISATNNCEYCVRIHTDRLRQLGTTNEELIETMMVVDVFNGYGKFAEGFRIGDSPTISTTSQDASGNPASHKIYDSSNRVCSSEGLAEMFELMAYAPDYLKSSWERSKLCTEEEGHLGLRLKHMLAFCIAATNSNDYFINVESKRLKDLGLSDKERVELVLVVDLCCGYNRYVQGLQVAMESKPFGDNAEANKAVSVAA